MESAGQHGLEAQFDLDERQDILSPVEDQIDLSAGMSPEAGSVQAAARRCQYLLQDEPFPGLAGGGMGRQGVDESGVGDAGAPGVR